MQQPHNLDKIKIEDMTLPCLIGIADKERVEKQNITINITLFADLAKSCTTDNIDDTINYRSIKNRIRDFIPTTSFFLIEKMADQLARICFEEPGVQALIVKVEKPGALTLARSVSVEIFRKREDYDF